MNAPVFRGMHVDACLSPTAYDCGYLHRSDLNPLLALSSHLSVSRVTVWAGGLLANVGTRSLPHRQSDDTVQRSKRLLVSMFHRTTPARRSGCDTRCYSSYTGCAGAGTKKEIYSNCGNIVLPLGFTSAGRTCTHNKRKADALSTNKFTRTAGCELVFVSGVAQIIRAEGLGTPGTHLALMDALASSACRVSIAASLERCSSASLCNCFTSSSMRSGYPCSPSDM